MGIYYTTYTLLANFHGDPSVVADLKASVHYGDPGSYGWGTQIFLTDVATNVSVLDAVELLPYTSVPVPINVQLQAAVAMCVARGANVGIKDGTMPLTALYTLDQYIAGNPRFNAESLVAVAENIEIYLGTINVTQDLVTNQYPAIYAVPANANNDGSTLQKFPELTYSPGWESWDTFNPAQAIQANAGSSFASQQLDNGFYTAQILFSQAVAQSCRLASIGRLSSIVALLNTAGQEYNNEQSKRQQKVYSVLNTVGINGRVLPVGQSPSYLPDLSSLYTAGFGAFNTLVSTYGGSLINRVFSHPITSSAGIVISVSTYADVARLPGPVTISISGTPVIYASGCAMLIGVGTGGAAGGGNPYDTNADGFLQAGELADVINDALAAAVTAQKAAGALLSVAALATLQTYVLASGFDPANMSDMAAAIQSIL